MAGFASLSIASALKVASLNLCADEYLLLLARADEIASVTRLAQNPDESPLYRAARRYPANRGTLESIVATRPTLVLTMGGSGRASESIAHALGIKRVNLPSPTSIADVKRNLVAVATALGDRRRAAPLLRQIDALEATAPARQRDTLFVSGGGSSLGGWSAAGEWMRLAGFRQRALPGGKVSLETLLTRPPAVLLRSEYRAGQMSNGQRWFEHPIARRLEPRTVRTDGRAWTCAGPLMIDEVKRLRAVAR